jgi:hypothetical protein
LAFVGLVIFGGHPFDGDGRAAAPPAVPASGPDVQSSIQQPPTQPGPATDGLGSSGGALPRADGVQAAAGEHWRPPDFVDDMHARIGRSH